MWPILIISFTLWAILPGVYFGNLHTDTLEIIYWGHDPAWGYSKHPPLITWILSTIIQPGTLSILTITAYGQLAAALSSYFVYGCVIRVAGRPTAILAACMMMLTSTATFYGVQVNHNSALVPFCGAVLHYGLLYLEGRRLRDALYFGLAAGFGALTKYEIVFALVPIAALSLAIPRHRPAFLSWGTAIAVLVACALLLPHIFWQSENGWVSFERATSSEPLDSVWAVLLGLYDVVIGLVTVLAGPVILLLTLGGSLPKAGNAGQPDANQRRVGLILFLTPILAVLLAGAATNQVIKILWMLPLAPSLVAGLALLLPLDRGGKPPTERVVVASSAKVSAGVFFLYVVYFFVGEAIDIPAESYLADTRPLSVAAEKLWSSHSGEPLKCVVVDEGKLAPSAVLWMASRPQILPIYVADWANPKRIADCNKTGGVSIKFEIDGPFNVEKKFPNACIQDELDFHVETVSRLARTGWNAKLVYIPPSNHPECGP